MTLQLSANSFLQMLAQSGLLTDAQLKRLENKLATKPSATAQMISRSLMHAGLITKWQSEKLLQARYRGFFLGSYRLLDKIARGGMSSIYSARHKETGEVHALKVLPLARTSKASYLPRFLREAQMTQRLVHPHIVRVFGVYEESDGQDPVHFMAMELLEGKDLFEIVNQSGPLSVTQAVEYIRQAATGLEYAHRNGLVHRDVKPGNLFVTTDDTVRILDLGLAQDFASEENLTRDFNERVLGTADYLAPEQAADSHSVDARADIYSLGCTLYFLLTGRAPFVEGTLVQRLVAHQTKSPPPLSDFRSDVPKALVQILLGMMARHREQRTVSAGTVAEQLSMLQKEESIRCLSEPTAIAAAHTTTLSNKMSNSRKADTVLQQEVDTATTAADDSWLNQVWQAIPESNSPQADATPAAADFQEFLQRIQKDCEQDGPMASDPRCAELASFVRRLVENHPLSNDQNDVYSPSNSVNTTATRAAVRQSKASHSEERHSEPATSPPAKMEHWMLLATLLLTLIAFVATQL